MVLSPDDEVAELVLLVDDRLDGERLAGRGEGRGLGVDHELRGRRLADGQGVARVGGADVVGRVGEDGLDGVGADGRAGGQRVAGAGDPGRDVDGDGRADGGPAAEDREGDLALVRRCRRAGHGGGEGDRLGGVLKGAEAFAAAVAWWSPRRSSGWRSGAARRRSWPCRCRRPGWCRYRPPSRPGGRNWCWRRRWRRSRRSWARPACPGC